MNVTVKESGSGAVCGACAAWKTGIWPETCFSETVPALPSACALPEASSQPPWMRFCA